METRFFRHTILDLAILTIILSSLLVLLNGSFCYATDSLPIGIDQAFKTDSDLPLGAVAAPSGFNTSVTFEIIVSTVLTIVLGFMGAIFLVLAIYAGYNWMMARGNEDMVEKAKKTLTNAIIGIIIVLGAYAMVRIIVDVVGSKVFKNTPAAEVGSDYDD